MLVFTGFLLLSVLGTPEIFAATAYLINDPPEAVQGFSECVTKNKRADLSWVLPNDLDRKGRPETQVLKKCTGNEHTRKFI